MPSQYSTDFASPVSSYEPLFSWCHHQQILGLSHLGDTPGSSLSLSCTCNRHYCVYVSPDLSPSCHPCCHAPLVSCLHQSRRFPSPPLGSPQTQGWGPTKLRHKRSTRYITFHMIWENSPYTLKIIRVNTYRALTMFQVQFYIICVVQHFWCS